jgi:hypothetical protein
MLIAFTIPLLVALEIPGAGTVSGSPEDLLREAFLLEVGRSDPAAAAALYREVLALPGLAPRTAVLARLRLGICLDLAGDRTAAEAELRSVCRDHSGEADATAAARRRLGQSPRDPARFMPPGVILYCEMVEMSRQVSFLSDLIRGTILENPVDSHLLGGAGSPEASDGAPPQIHQLRSLLNVPFLKELGKIEGIAFGATSLDMDRPAWLLVFLPGSSDLSRAVIHAVLSGVMDPSPPESLEGMRIFKLKRERIHAALDEKEEVFLLGADRQMVVDAIRRAAGGAGAPESLAGVDDFRRAQAARAGSMLFAYADRERSMAALRAATAESALPSFDEARRLLGLDHLRAVAATLARAGDDLRLTLRARVDRTRHPLWSNLSTPPLGRDAFAFVPERAPLYFATAAVDGERRWRTFRAEVEPLLAGIRDKEGGAKARDLFAFLDGLPLDFGRDFLGEIRSVAIAIPPHLSFPRELSIFAVLGFEDGDRAAPRVEALLEAVARKAFGPDVRAAFREEEPRGSVRLRSFEARQGFKVLYAREGSTFVLSPLAATVLDAVDARTKGAEEPRVLVPALASKVFVLRPQALWALAAREPKDPAEAFSALCPLAIFLTEEAPEGFAVEARIPGATSVIRKVLQELPKLRLGAPGPGRD